MTAPMTPDINFLKKIYIFRDLTEAEIETMARVLTPRSRLAGELLMKEGEEGDSMYVIAEGEVEITKSLTMRFGQDDYRETEKTMSRLSARDYGVIGEMALISRERRSATVACRSGCLFYEIKRDDFLLLATQNPGLGFKITHRLAKLMARRLKKTGEDVVRLTTALSIALGK